MMRFADMLRDGRSFMVVAVNTAEVESRSAEAFRAQHNLWRQFPLSVKANGWYEGEFEQVLVVPLVDEFYRTFAGRYTGVLWSALELGQATVLWVKADGVVGLVEAGPYFPGTEWLGKARAKESEPRGDAWTHIPGADYLWVED